jgi:hypothetical protein
VAANLTNRRQINSVVNGTLLSDETNNTIKAKAPADYLASPDIFPSGPGEALLAPHFLGGQTMAVMRDAKGGLDAGQAQEAYERFCQAREAAIVAEIRRVSGVPAPVHQMEPGAAASR